jgi:hypothetical protein
MHQQGSPNVVTTQERLGFLRSRKEGVVGR